MATGRQELLRLIEDFGKIPLEVRRELRPKIREVTGPTVAKVKANASWSSRIPGATTTKVALGKRPGIRINVNSKLAPHARPFEHGGQSGFFRHVVFGNRRVWVVQRARPFLYGPVAADASSLAQQIADVVPEVASRHGFRH